MNPLRRNLSGLAAGLSLTAAALAGCSSPPAPPEEAVHLTPVAGTDRYDVTLSAQARQRLGIVTSPVRTAAGLPVTATPGSAPGTGSAATGSGATGSGAPGTAVPYAAVVYDSAGDTWAYTPHGDLTYTRVPISVARIQGSYALLDAGPAVGTPVVTVGAPELLGAEAQIAGEE